MTVIVRSIAFAMALAAVLPPAAAFAVQATVTNALRVENDSIDLGKVVAGRTASATYVFHNDGPTDIKILRASPS